MAKRIVISTRTDDIALGGKGSGHFGHKGRKGYRGGSEPSTRQIGVTSARPGKTTEQVATELAQFKEKLQATTVANLSVSLGTGGWDGGAEPTFVTQYDGNGQGLKALCEFAKQHDQDGVLVQTHTSWNDPRAQPQNRLTFSRSLDAQQITAIERVLVEKGIGGWTWFSRNGKICLMTTCVPQWGGEKSAHLDAVREVANILTRARFGFTEEVLPVVVQAIDRGDYDDIINRS